MTEEDNTTTRPTPSEPRLDDSPCSPSRTCSNCQHYVSTHGSHLCLDLPSTASQGMHIRQIREGLTNECPYFQQNAQVELTREDRNENREIEDWWDDDGILKALEWFLERGEKA